MRTNWDGWGTCALVLFAIALFLFVLVLNACGGSQFFEAPPNNAPDTSDCGEASRTFSSTAPYTAFPFPFRGTQKVDMHADRPPAWDLFRGQLYLIGADWTVDWVSYVRMSVEPYPNLAVWDGRRWSFDSRVDVYPLLSETDDGRLTIKPTFHARGIKPAGKQTIAVTVVLAVCGEGQEFISER